MDAARQVGVKLDELAHRLEGASAVIGVCLPHLQHQTTVPMSEGPWRRVFMEYERATAQEE
jgi:hypothetical protein